MASALPGGTARGAVACVLAFISSISANAQIDSWTFLGLENEVVRSLLVDPRDPETIFAGANTYFTDPGTGGVFKSTDGGVTWDTTGLMRHDVWKLALDPSNRDIIYAACFVQDFSESGVFRSTDAGTTWYNCSAGMPLDWEVGVPDVAVHPTRPSTVYAAVTGFGAGGLYQSSNRGDNWFELLPYPNNPCHIIRVNPLDPEILLIDSVWGIKRSTDSGRTWTVVYPMNGGAECIEVVSQLPHTVYAAVRDEGVLKSVDQGSTWVKKNRGLFIEGRYVPFPTSIAIHPSQPNIVCLGTWDHGLFWSRDGGDFWKRMEPPVPDSSVVSVLFCHDRQLLVGTESGIWRGSLATGVKTNSESQVLIAVSGEALRNYPNPFNERTTIEFKAEKAGAVTLRIYDLAGCLVRDFGHFVPEFGNNSVVWDGTNDKGEPVSSGVYYGTLCTNWTRKRIKMLLVR